MNMALKVVLGLLGGGVFGAFCGATLAAGFIYGRVKGTEAEVRKDVTLVPVVVAAHDTPAGTTLLFEGLSQRSVPETMVTSSIVKPDSASYVVNQKLVAPVLAGDPLLWGFFETTQIEFKELDLKAACEKALEGTPYAPKREPDNASIRARLAKAGKP